MTDTPPHTLIYAYCHAYILSISYTRSLSHSLIHTLLSFTHLNIHTVSHAHINSLTLTITPSLSPLSYFHYLTPSLSPLTLTITPSLSPLSLSPLILSLPLSLFHSLTPSLLPLSHSPSLPLSPLPLSLPPSFRHRLSSMLSSAKRPSVELWLTYGYILLQKEHTSRAAYFANKSLDLDPTRLTAVLLKAHTATGKRERRTILRESIKVTRRPRYTLTECSREIPV